MKYLAFLILLCACTGAFAGWSSTSGKVTNVTSHNGSILITTGITDGPCGNGKGFWWAVSDNDAQFTFSLGLTAFQQVKILKMFTVKIHQTVNGIKPRYLTCH